MLSRKLEQRSHYPAIDVLYFVSRVGDDVTDAEHAEARRRVVRLIAMYREVEDLVQIGAYARGSNPETDVAIDMHNAIDEILRQSRGPGPGFEESRALLIKLAAQASEASARLARARR